MGPCLSWMKGAGSAGLVSCSAGEHGGLREETPFFLVCVVFFLIGSEGERHAFIGWPGRTGQEVPVYQ
jgi:hypothetical protein